MKPLRVVMVMLEPPLPFGNAAARWYYVLYKGLIERGHRVTAFAACSEVNDIAKAQALFPAPEYDLRCYPFPVRKGLSAQIETIRKPFSYMFSPELKSDLQATLAAGYDILHLEQLFCAWLALDIPAKTLVNVHYLAWIDQEFVRPAKLLDRWRQTLMFATERRLLAAMRHISCCTPRLVPEIVKANAHANVTVIPLGLDAAQYRYIPDAERSSEPVVSVIGNMGWYPTISAAQRLMTRLWPVIKQRVPAARVQIVGWNARKAMAEYLNVPDVEVVENVPEIEPYFRKTAVLLYAPARGSGMKIKICEALAFGIPVVTTAEGVEGLPAEDGVHAGIAEDDAGLIERAVQLLTDPVLQNRYRAAGRAMLESHCGPTPTVDAVERLYAEIVGPSPEPHG